MLRQVLGSWWTRAEQLYGPFSSLLNNAHVQDLGQPEESSTHGLSMVERHEQTQKWKEQADRIYSVPNTPGEYRKAAHLYQSIVDTTGDADAMFKLGALYVMRVMLDSPEKLMAKRLLLAAAGQHHADALYMLGTLHRLRPIRIPGFDYSPQQAMHYLTEAARLGLPRALFTLALIQYGNGERIQAVNGFEQAALRGFEPALLTTAVLRLSPDQPSVFVLEDSSEKVEKARNILEREWQDETCAQLAERWLGFLHKR